MRANARWNIKSQRFLKCLRTLLTIKILNWKFIYQTCNRILFKTVIYRMMDNECVHILSQLKDL